MVRTATQVQIARHHAHRRKVGSGILRRGYYIVVAVHGGFVDVFPCAFGGVVVTEGVALRHSFDVVGIHKVGAAFNVGNFACCRRVFHRETQKCV